MPFVTEDEYQRLLASSRENQELHRRLEALEREATIDALTGLHRRPVLDRALERERNRRARAAEGGHAVEPLTLLFIDIDHFKRVNDTFGHQVGDTVIAAVAKTVKDSLRITDLAVRWGGEELAVLLPATDIDGAFSLADRIRQSVAELVITTPAMQPVPVTISIGVACAASAPIDQNDVTVELLHRADQALYQAKNGGRNRVCQLAA